MFVVKTHCEDAGAELEEITDKLKDLYKSFYQSSFENDSLKKQMAILGFYLGVGKFSDLCDGVGKFHPLQVEDCDVAIAARDDTSFEVIQATTMTIIIMSMISNTHTHNINCFSVIP